MTDSAPAFQLGRLSWSEEIVYLRKTFANYAETLLELFGRFGDVYARRLPNNAVILNHPRHVKHVLRTNVLNYPKSSDYEFLRPILGNGLFVSDGQLWTRQRKLVAPEFRAAAVERFLPVIIECVSSLFEEWDRQPGQVRDLSDDMMRLTLWVVGSAMFHSDFRAEAEAIGHCLEVCLTAATKQMMSLGLYRPWMPTPENRRVRQAERTLDEIVRGLIARGRRGELHGTSVLSRLVSAADAETGAAMDDQQLLDEVKSLILAGHETTSLALAWSFYLLAEHPEVEARIVEEARRVYGAEVPRAEHVVELEQSRRVLMETMRLYPPVPAVTRAVLEEDEIDGIRITPRERVIVAPYVTHRHPAVWERPDAFEPDRFAPERVEARDPYAYMPFLLGRRECVGEHFALLEGIVALSMIVGRYELTRTDDRPIGTRPISTLRMARPLCMRVRRRA